jgi:hypothetical protein
MTKRFLVLVAVAACSGKSKSPSKPEPSGEPDAAPSSTAPSVDAAPKSVWDTTTPPAPTDDFVLVAKAAPLFALRPEMPPPVESSTGYYRYRVVAADPRWITVETGEQNDPGHCEKPRPDLDDLALHVHVPRSALGTVVVKPIVVERGKKTRVEAEPGVRVTGGENPGQWSFTIRDAPVTVPIAEDALGEMYRPVVQKPRPTVEYEIDRRTPSSAFKFGDGANFALHVASELECFNAYDRERAGSSDLVTIYDRCARARVLVASKWVKKGACNMAGVYGAIRKVKVRDGAPAWWPDTRRAGRALAGARFDIVGYDRDGKRCLQRQIAKAPTDVDSLGGSLVLCFDPEDVTVQP